MGWQWKKENSKIRGLSQILGVINGANINFVLETKGKELLLFKNGMFQTPGIDYILSENQYNIIFNNSNIPQEGDNLIASVIL